MMGIYMTNNSNACLHNPLHVRLTVTRTTHLLGVRTCKGLYYTFVLYPPITPTPSDCLLAAWVLQLHTGEGCRTVFAVWAPSN